MWVTVLNASRLATAQMWKDLFQAEGVPSRVLPADEKAGMGSLSSYKVMIPVGRQHVVKEILKHV